MRCFHWLPKVCFRSMWVVDGVWVGFVFFSMIIQFASAKIRRDKGFGVGKTAQIKVCACCALNACENCLASSNGDEPQCCHPPDHGRRSTSLNQWKLFVSRCFSPSVCLACASKQRTIIVPWDRVLALQRPYVPNLLVANIAIIPEEHGLPPFDYRFFSHFYSDFGGLGRGFEIFDADDSSLWSDSPLSVAYVLLFPLLPFFPRLDQTSLCVCNCGSRRCRAPCEPAFAFPYSPERESRAHTAALVRWRLFCRTISFSCSGFFFATLSSDDTDIA